MIQLTVRLLSLLESNGKRNWQAYFVRQNNDDFEGLIGSLGGVCIAWGEHFNRVAYEAERARFLIGERTTEPKIWAYSVDVGTPEDWKGVDSEAKVWFN